MYEQTGSITLLIQTQLILQHKELHANLDAALQYKRVCAETKYL
jgi:hypothetical protein